MGESPSPTPANARSATMPLLVKTACRTGSLPMDSALWAAFTECVKNGSPHSLCLIFVSTCSLCLRICDSMMGRLPNKFRLNFPFYGLPAILSAGIPHSDTDIRAVLLTKFPKELMKSTAPKWAAGAPTNEFCNSKCITTHEKRARNCNQRKKPQPPTNSVSVTRHL